jgi:quercetin 2,3-dioxygenase
MKSVVHRAGTRGHANHGWLDSYHTFSFGGYRDHERMGFGLIRVLNDDTVAPGMGFGMHPHENMEIISIPLEGNLKHTDDMGNSVTIRQGDVQVMSAGTGVMHSEYNASDTEPVKFLQIWVFPKEKSVKPRYQQVALSEIAVKNKFYQILSPNPNDQGVWIHQDAWFHIADFDDGYDDTYTLKNPKNGLYIFVISGSITVGDVDLNARDGYGIWDVDSLEVNATKEAHVLLMEVPV